jgi:hypothetical protein
MQKVVGSSPIIRSSKAPLRRGFALVGRVWVALLCPDIVPSRVASTTPGIRQLTLEAVS